MTGGGDLLIRNVEVAERPGLDVRITGGRIAEIGVALRGSCPDLDGRGGALIPGLIDHHIHLFGLAAAASSVRLTPDLAGRADAFARLLRERDAALPAGEAMRVIGYHESVAGDLDGPALDRLVVDRPLRVQHRSGALWVLNAAALAQVFAPGEAPPCVECDADCVPTGRIWRGDDWLRQKNRSATPSLAGIGAQLARYGVTGVTDASVTTDQAQAEMFASAVSKGELRQRLVLMSGGPLSPTLGDSFKVGPIKLLLDDADLPDLDDVVEQIRRAHAWGRCVAVHCVTAGELAFALAAICAAGARPGDRIEHGGVIHPQAAEEIGRLGLTVVTQPGLLVERGDRYLAEVDARDIAFLYPCASLRRRGIAVAASSDAPYAGADPWAAMGAAVHRRTPSGRLIGADERLQPRLALGLFLGNFEDPGGAERRVTAGVVADLCLLRTPIGPALESLSADLVASTIIGGVVVR